MCNVKSVLFSANSVSRFMLACHNFHLVSIFHIYNNVSPHILEFLLFRIKDGWKHLQRCCVVNFARRAHSHKQKQ